MNEQELRAKIKKLGETDAGGAGFGTRARDIKAQAQFFLSKEKDAGNTHDMSQVQATTPSGKKKTVGIAQDASDGVLSIVVLGATGDLAKKVT